MTIFYPNGDAVSRETLEGLKGFREYPSNDHPEAEDLLLNLHDSPHVHMHLSGDKAFPRFEGRDTRAMLGEQREIVTIRMEEASRQARAKISVEEGARFGSFLSQLDNLIEAMNG